MLPSCCISQIEAVLTKLESTFQVGFLKLSFCCISREGWGKVWRGLGKVEERVLRRVGRGLDLAQKYFTSQVITVTFCYMSRTLQVRSSLLAFVTCRELLESILRFLSFIIGIKPHLRSSSCLIYLCCISQPPKRFLDFQNFGLHCKATVQNFKPQLS